MLGLPAATRIVCLLGVELGFKLVAVSGYRDWSYQSSLFQTKTTSIMRGSPKLSRAEAEKLAAKVVAPPGESEHELGTTVDFTTGVQIAKGGDVLTNAFGATEEYAMLAKEAWRFGWVNSLMPGKERLTGRMTEQWHWRYVGIPHAEIMWSKGWVPEEYRDYMRDHQGVAFRSSTGALYWVRYDNGTKTVIASALVDRTSVAAVGTIGG
ncbi:MAG: D-alanyl-D-alanine carboxypeptidase [Firmicutes bacterium ADurb.Bin506]|nr:MAG: D-alanyl-D-alanine carboxypeptidase [Firmicutes bacterium ADurb.Bin506]